MRAFERSADYRLYTVRSGSGLPFLFLHGLGGSSKQILGAYDPLPGVELFTMDQQGHGQSSCAGAPGFRQLAQDALAFMDREGVERFVLGGISMGAAVSTLVALMAPKRVLGLAIVRPAWTHEPMRPEVREAFATCAAYLRTGDREGYLQTPMHQSLAALSAYTAGSFVGNFDDPAHRAHYAKFLSLPLDAPFESPAQLEALRLPCLVLANGQDWVHPEEYGAYYHQHIPGSTYHLIPDKDSNPAGHRQAMNRHLHAWLTGFLP